YVYRRRPFQFSRSFSTSGGLPRSGTRSERYRGYGRNTEVRAVIPGASGTSQTRLVRRLLRGFWRDRRQVRGGAGRGRHGARISNRGGYPAPPLPRAALFVRSLPRRAAAGVSDDRLERRAFHGSQSSLPVERRRGPHLGRAHPASRSLRGRLVRAALSGRESILSNNLPRPQASSGNTSPDLAFACNPGPEIRVAWTGGLRTAVPGPHPPRR